MQKFCWKQSQWIPQALVENQTLKPDKNFLHIVDSPARAGGFYWTIPLST